VRVFRALPVVLVVAACGAFDAEDEPVSGDAGTDAGPIEAGSSGSLEAAAGDGESVVDGSDETGNPLVQAKTFHQSAVGTSTVTLDHAVGANHWVAVVLATVGNPPPKPNLVQIGGTILTSVIVNEEQVVGLFVYGLPAPNGLVAPTVSISWSGAGQIAQAVIFAEFRGKFLGASNPQNGANSTVIAGPTPDVTFAGASRLLFLAFAGTGATPLDGPSGGFAPLLEPIVEGGGQLISASFATTDPTPKQTSWSFGGTLAWSSGAVVLALP
jgi:hypothetical protein